VTDEVDLTQCLQKLFAYRFSGSVGKTSTFAVDNFVCCGDSKLSKTPFFSVFEKNGVIFFCTNYSFNWKSNR